MIVPVMLLFFILLVFLLVLFLVIASTALPRRHDLAAFSAQQCAACPWRPPRVRRASGHGGRSAALPLARPSETALTDAGAMEDRLRQWRDAHPPRGYYVWQRLNRIKKTHGLPRDTSVQIAGGMWTLRRKRRDSGSRAGGASGASAGRGVTAEFLCVPCAQQRIEVGQDAAAIGKADDLFVYQDSASGELFQQTTSVRRWFELAKTHPGATAFFTSSCRQRPARDDERGRAVEGDQGGRILWLSLAVSGKEFRAGISTEGVASSLVACWWCPEGSDWDPAEIQEARRVWLDLCEADGNEAFGASTRDDVLEGDADSAAAGAASGAPEGREKKIAPARGPDVDVCLSDSNSPSGEASNSQQSVSSGTLKREGWPVPNPSQFRSGIRHVSGNEGRQGQLFDVARAFTTQKQHFFLGELYEALKGVGFDDPCFFCEAFRSLQPAPGGAQRRVERVDCCHRPIWDTLRGGWDIDSLPGFLKHFGNNKHDGEVRLLTEAWAPAARDVDVRHLAFWRPQFVKDERSRQFLSERDSKKWLGRDGVAWVFQNNDDQTQVIKRYVAASGARWCMIRRGTAVTLAQMYYHGCKLCTAFDIYKLYMDLPILIREVVGHCEKRNGQRRRGRGKGGAW